MSDESMDTMKTMRRRSVIMAAAIVLFAAAPALAHDPNELGAGPGPANAAAVHKIGDDHSAMKMDGEATPADDHRSGEMAMGHMHDDSPVGKTFGQRLFNWLGRLHVMVIHFPIAMIIGAFGVEAFGLWRRNVAYQEAARIMLIVGALGAIVAASLGWFAGGFYLADRNPVLMTHRWLGTAIAVFASVLAYLSFAARRRDRPRTIYWILLAALTVAISIQGWLGGSFMHGGLRHLAF